MEKDEIIKYVLQSQYFFYLILILIIQLHSNYIILAEVLLIIILYTNFEFFVKHSFYIRIFFRKFTFVLASKRQNPPRLQLLRELL